MPPDQQIRNRVAVLIVQDGKILLVQHQKNNRKYWVLPGGGVEFGETLHEAARREVEEETGLEAVIGDFLFLLESIPPDRHRHVINYYFSGRVVGGQLRMGEDDVLCGVEWHRVDDLPHLPMYPQTVHELLEIIQTGSVESRSLGNRWV